MGESWAVLSSLEQSIKRKIEAVGTPLKDWGVSINYGIKTGFNDAFIISGEKRRELITADPKSAEIIRPILRGKDIKRYGYDFKDKWVIITHNGLKEKNIPPIDVKKYPAIKAHLDKFYMQLTKRQDKGGTPYNLRSCAYMEDFSKQKIVWAELARTGNAFTYDEGQNIVLNTSYILVNHDKNISLKYLLANLNSKIILFYMNIISSKFDKNGWRWLKQFVELLPILQKPNQNIEKYVEKILEIKNKNNDSADIEHQLNLKLYNIYNLNESEKDFIENYNFNDLEI